MSDLDTREERIAEWKRALEYAPPPSQIADGLLGWRTSDGAHLCAQCASRLIGRGFSVPRGSTPLWADQSLTPPPCDACGGAIEL